MIKRITVFLLVIFIFLKSSVTVLACNEEQTNTYVLQVLFGNNGLNYENDKNIEKLLDALYICSEQSDKKGQDKLDSLKKAGIVGVSALTKINISNEYLFDCSHNAWNYISRNSKKVQEVRKNVLRKTVVNIFDFGWFNEKFKTNSGKIDSFSALLYYTHILADYLADDPIDTTVSVKGYDIPAYSGCPKYELNGNKPTFTDKQKRETKSYKQYSDLDIYKRCGANISNIGLDTLENITSKKYIGNIYPTGWIEGNKKYEEVLPDYLYNRCHLIAHSLGGIDTLYNLVTGTRYLNESMIEYENKIAEYIKNTSNHVLYRVTPIYKGDNMVASGIQLEAYSIEDKGKGICFNIYLYNVQPGIDINYANGNSELADNTVGASDIILFATLNANDNNSDLMYEIEKQLEILFADQKNTDTYENMIQDLESIGNEARNIGECKKAKEYLKLKEYQYDYMKKLSEYVPKLLEKENFFNSVFN